MNLSCPYCGNPLPKDLVQPPLSKRQMRIYRAVCASGPEGIPVKELIVAMFDGKPPAPSAYGMLRTQINAINGILARQEQKISGSRRGSYRLIGR